MKTVVTIRIDADVKKRLEKIARATQRTQSFLIADAIQEYLRVNEWQVEAIMEGVRQADGGDLTPHSEVRKRWEAKLGDRVD